MNQWSVADIPSQHGKLAVITGATGGLGYETALALAGAGAEVRVTGRNAEKGRVAIERIKRAVPSANVRFEMLDLASLNSVRAFAAKMVANDQPLDLLINNAGVMDLPGRRLTEDGFEMQLGTNHLSHFALTGLLLPVLLRAEARVVNISSLAHRGGKIDFDNLQAERKYRSWPAYQQSKLANLLFTFELQRRSDSGGWGLMSNAAHPGYARTDLIPNGPGTGGLKGAGARLVGSFMSHSAAAGALPTLFAATSPTATPMGYYGPNGFYELKGAVAPAKVLPQAKDETVARKLWEVSERLTGVKWPVGTQSSGAVPFAARKEA
ncbi:MAG: oxidoreductase [Acidobacteriaceae bacterium]|jgi:NAD(P)-dependent dehydrogenase (short-subunit alcohol dehydrogenase family)